MFDVRGGIGGVWRYFDVHEGSPEQAEDAAEEKLGDDGVWIERKKFI